MVLILILCKINLSMRRTDINMIYFSDDELIKLGYEQKGNILIVDGEEYLIKRAVDGKYKRGYEVIKIK